MSDDNIMSQALATNRNLVGASCHFFFLVGISVFNIYGIADDVLSHSSGVWKSQTRQKHWAIPPGTSYFSSYTPPSALLPLYLSLEISEVCGCEELWIIKQIKIALNIYSVYKEQTLKTKGNHLHSFLKINTEEGRTKPLTTGQAEHLCEYES